MKTLLSIILAGCLTSCIFQTPEPEAYTSSGKFQIIEYAEPGTIKQQWVVTSYYETDFPKSVYFDYNGRRIVLKGSYQINEYSKP